MVVVVNFHLALVPQHLLAWNHERPRRDLLLAHSALPSEFAMLVPVYPLMVHVDYYELVNARVAAGEEALEKLLCSTFAPGLAGAREVHWAF